MTSKLSDLHLDLLPLAELFLYDLRREGLKILVTCTFRSNEDQEALYAQGRTTPGTIVTKARGGQSEHNFMIGEVPASRAFDIVPMNGSKCDWDEKSENWKKIGEVWSRGYRKNGFYLDWLGKKNSKFKDLPHFCLKTDNG